MLNRLHVRYKIIKHNHCWRSILLELKYYSTVHGNNAVNVESNFFNNVSIKEILYDRAHRTGTFVSYSDFVLNTSFCALFVVLNAF